MEEPGESLSLKGTRGKTSGAGRAQSFVPPCTLRWRKSLARATKRELIRLVGSREKDGVQPLSQTALKIPERILLPDPAAFCLIDSIRNQIERFDRLSTRGARFQR